MQNQEEEIITMGDVVESGDCSGCPLYNNECPGGWKCYGGEPIEPPCCGWDDDVLAMTPDEYYDSYLEDVRLAEESYDRMLKFKSDSIRKRKIEIWKLRYLKTVYNVNSKEVDEIWKTICDLRGGVAFARIMNNINSSLGMGKFANVNDGLYEKTMDELEEKLNRAKEKRDKAVEDAKKTERYASFDSLYANQFFDDSDWSKEENEELMELRRYYAA